MQNQTAATFGRTLEALKDEFMAMSAPTTNPQQRGLDFEKFLYKVFALFDMEPRLHYVLEHEQIDGAMTSDTDNYIIEAKWTKPRVEASQVYVLAQKVERKVKNTLGLYISISGFTSGALEAYRERTPFLTLDGDDLFCVLDQRVRLDELLKRKKQHASDTGSCHFPARLMI